MLSNSFDFGDLKKSSTSMTNSVPNFYANTNISHATYDTSLVDNHTRITKLIDHDKEKNNEKRRRRRRRGGFWIFCCSCCSPCCCLLTGLLLALVIAGLAALIGTTTSATTTTTTSVTTTTSTSSTSSSTSSTATSTTSSSSTSSSSTSSTSSSSTSSTSVTTTSRTTTSVTTITSNSCTSGWKSVTLLYHCSNCPDIAPYTQYTYTYTAISNRTRIAFAFREDSGCFALDAVSVRSIITPSTELIANNGFETGTLSSWTYCNPSSATAAGEVKQNSDSFQCMGYTYQAQSGTHFYYDGAVGNCDYLIQMFTTIVSQTYTISYWLYNQGTGSASSADVIISI
ncbi:unnamed protein product [Rotaria sp. Silwood1]|nr:unnamed protein product [Rotaria sp. Silwood1]